jgi:hypothetical protein
MIHNFIRARHHWDRGESEQAINHLNQVLSSNEAEPGFYWTASEVTHQAGLPFEIAVANMLLTEDVLLCPFDAAFARLWNALPLQYLILILSQRQPDEEHDAPVINLLLRAADSGLLSMSASDYDLSGKVVLDPEAYPQIVHFLGGQAVISKIEQASAGDAWTHQIAPNADLIVDLFLYAVFHREPTVQPTAILGRLERIADSHDRFLAAFSAHLRARLADPTSHAPLVSIGMRMEQAANASICLEHFMQALGSRQFEAFVERWYPDV